MVNLIFIDPSQGSGTAISSLAVHPIHTAIPGTETATFHQAPGLVDPFRQLACQIEFQIGGYLKNRLHSTHATDLAVIDPSHSTHRIHSFKKEYNPYKKRGEVIPPSPFE
jgi:hypothetical protein